MNSRSSAAMVIAYIMYDASSLNHGPREASFVKREALDEMQKMPETSTLSEVSESERKRFTLHERRFTLRIAIVGKTFVNAYGYCLPMALNIALNDLEVFGVSKNERKISCTRALWAAWSV